MYTCVRVCACVCTCVCMCVYMCIKHKQFKVKSHAYILIQSQTDILLNEAYDSTI